MVQEKEVAKIKQTIGELVYDKTALRKAYNYYHAKRDADQFRHLEENFGIGTPTQISFTPLIKKHIDVLVGEYLGLNQDLKVSCKDEATVSKIMREKGLKINAEVYSYLKGYLQNTIISSILEDKEITNDPFIEKELLKIKEDIEQSFTSEYEIAAQNILKYLRQSRNIDLKRKMTELLTDLLITGTCYYRVKPSEKNTNVCLEILNPLDTFVEGNYNSPYLADCKRVVIRKWMSTEEIINQYRDELTREAVKKIMDMTTRTDNWSPTYLVRFTGQPTGDNLRPNIHTGVLGGLEAHPGWPGDYNSVEVLRNNMIPVHEVEWLEVDEKTGNLTRHEGVQIGGEIYITRGESEFIVRSVDYPSKCKLSVNGMFFLAKNGDPYSLIIRTMDLQDKYDMLQFYRDNLIASSGTVGDWVDMAFLPTSLGVNFPERLQKFLAYKKQGIGLFDSSQEQTQSMMNTAFNGYDDTLKSQAIQAIQIAIQAIEMQASSITGVLPERLAQYEQRDAVSNVQLGVKMSGLLTKQYFETMDLMYKEVNYDMLNLAKLVYPKGLTGTIVLGDKYSKIFTALPENYTITDFDIHIEDSSESIRNMETVKAINVELIKAGMSDPDMAVTIASATNMTELKRYVEQATRSKKEENNTAGQLQQKVQQDQQTIQQLQKQLQELQAQLEQAGNKLNEQNDQKLLIEKEKLALEKRRVDNEKAYNDQIVENKNKQLEVQVAQMFDENPYNNKIKTST